MIIDYLRQNLGNEIIFLYVKKRFGHRKRRHRQLTHFLPSYPNTKYTDLYGQNGAFEMVFHFKLKSYLSYMQIVTYEESNLPPASYWLEDLDMS